MTQIFGKEVGRVIGTFYKEQLNLLAGDYIINDVTHGLCVSVLSQSIRTKDTERGFIYPIDKSLLRKMQSRTVRCAKLT